MIITTKDWHNGVFHRPASGSAPESYTLPTQAPGVPQEIFISGDSLSAHDAQGHDLKVQFKHHKYVVDDAQNGLETVLDPKKETVLVSTPQHEETEWIGPQTYQATLTQDAQELLDANGQVTLVRHFNHTTVTEMITTNPTLPPTMLTLRDDTAYERTDLAPQGAPSTNQVLESMSGTQSSPVATHLEGSALVYPDGTRFELFLTGPASL